MPKHQWKANHLVPASQSKGLGKLLALNPLNYLLGVGGHVADGGVLALEEEHLVFRPHSLNLHPEAFTLPLATMSDVRPFRRSAAAGIIVTLEHEQEEKFIVGDRENVANVIQQALHTQNS